MKTASKRFAATLLAGVVIAAGLVTASPASAATLPGTVTINPTSGNVNTDTVFLEGFTVSTGCPVNYRAASITMVYQNGVNMGNISIKRTAAMNPVYGQNGLDGNPISMNRTSSPTNQFVTNKLLSEINTPLATGDFELRIYCHALEFTLDYVNDPYFPLAMTFDATSGAWALDIPAAPVEQTTVSLVAGNGTAAGTVNLTATVKKADGTTATAAAGTVEFLEGATVVGSAAVASGVASFTTPVVADGAHSYTARFVSSDGTVYANSPASGPSTVQVGGQSEETVVDVTVPNGVGSLTLSGVPATVSLGTAALNGGLLTASGNLTNIVVTDTRQLGSAAWSLTGQTTDFVDGAKVLSGKYLGWAPALVGASSANAGVAGAAVVAGVGSGLKAVSTLSSGSVVDGRTTTTLNAALTLAAPSNTTPGAYSATLTVTLI